VVNVGSADEVTVLDLAHRVLDQAGAPRPEACVEYSGGVEHVPFERVYGEGFVDPRRRRPDLARLVALTGFAPTRTLDDAIRDVLADLPARV
jgi:UDP-glucose 4-epimerase